MWEIQTIYLVKFIYFFEILTKRELGYLVASTAFQVGPHQIQLNTSSINGYEIKMFYIWTERLEV